MILTPEDLARCAEIANGPALVHAIVEEVAFQTRITPAEILGARRWAHIAAARQLVCFIANERGVTPANIALAMNRDVSTVKHSIAQERKRRGE